MAAVGAGAAAATLTSVSWSSANERDDAVSGTGNYTYRTYSSLSTATPSTRRHLNMEDNNNCDVSVKTLSVCDGQLSYACGRQKTCEVSFVYERGERPVCVGVALSEIDHMLEMGSIYKLS
ncbi:hypothetical protein ABVT39_008375 [Epinephelus coioides]